MRCVIAVIVLLAASAGSARAQALEIDQGFGGGALRVTGRLADKYQARGAVGIDVFVHARHAGWELRASFGPRWGWTGPDADQGFSLLGFRGDLARYGELAHATRVRPHEIAELSLEAYARGGVVRWAVDIGPVGQLGGADLDGWSAGVGLLFRAVFHDHPGDIGYVWRAFVDVGVDRIGDSRFDTLTFGIGMLGGGR